MDLFGIHLAKEFDPVGGVEEQFKKLPKAQKEVEKTGHRIFSKQHHGLPTSNNKKSCFFKPGPSSSSGTVKKTNFSIRPGPRRNTHLAGFLFSKKTLSTVTDPRTGRTKLHDALGKNDLKTIKRLCASGVDLNTNSSFQRKE